MEKKIVGFGGITNVPDDGLNEAGDMAVLMNMRHKGGELVPCQRPESIRVGEYAQILYHANSGYWLAIEDQDLGVYDKDMNYVPEQGIISGGVESFALMGNIVIMNFADRVEYAIWRNGGYVKLGKLPEVPSLSASELKEKTIKRQTEEEYYTSYEKDHKELWNRTVQKGFIDEILNTVYEKRGYVDRAWFRVGLKMFDGSYIALSGIYQLSARKTGQDDLIGVQINKMWYASSDTGGGNEHYTARVGYFVPELAVGALPDKWRDVITSIVVFSTGSIMSYVVGKERGERAGTLVTDEYEWYRMRTAEELKDAMLNAEFYKVAEFGLNGEELWSIDNTSPSNLAVQPSLKDIQVHSFSSRHMSVINSRLHLPQAKNIYFKGYAPAYRYDNSIQGRTDKTWTVVVYIQTDVGERRVVYREGDGYKPDLLYYFMYPDSRAVRMEIYRESNDYGTGLEVLRLPLIPHRNRNEAYFLKTKTESITFQATEDGDDKYYADIPIIDTDLKWESATAIPEADDVEEQSGILKVSAVDNPFYFPTVQTYKFEGEIKGLASNAEAISTGQFGQYPLFVFTDAGIWAMSVDASGQGAYTTQSPFSREVCNGAICPVSGGIVFTTERGVMAISGGQVADLSAVLDGFEVDFFGYNSEMWKKIFDSAGKRGIVNPMPIRDYIKDAVIAYNYHYNEIIVSNKGAFLGGEIPYSYVYSLTNKEWSIIDTVFDMTTNKYPELVVFDSQGAMYTFKDGSAQNNVVAITRPFTFGSLDFKRIRQAGLRTTFKGELNFYLLGSVDGAEFKCITGREYDSGDNMSGTQRDLITAMSRSKQYKYFIIAVVGNIEGRISMAELLVDMGFANNQLR